MKYAVLPFNQYNQVQEKRKSKDETIYMFYLWVAKIDNLYIGLSLINEDRVSNFQHSYNLEAI